MKDFHASPLPAIIDSSWKIGIVASLYHRAVVDALVDGAKTLLLSAGIPAANITVHDAPGSFEIPLIGAALAQTQTVDALLGFGVIVEGETHHARLLAETVAHGMMNVQTKELIPFAFEVLYVDSLDQAIARTQGADHKGVEAARSVLRSLDTLRTLRDATDRLRTN